MACLPIGAFGRLPLPTKVRVLLSGDHRLSPFKDSRINPYNAVLGYPHAGLFLTFGPHGNLDIPIQPQQQAQQALD